MHNMWLEVQPISLKGANCLFYYALVGLKNMFSLISKIKNVIQNTIPKFLKAKSWVL